MKKENVVDFDTHMKILRFLIYLQSTGHINESQKNYYSMFIQEHLKEKENDIKFLESFLENIK